MVGARAVQGESLGERGSSRRSSWQAIDWRTHQRWIRINDDVLNVIELGKGPPLLFVHGLSGSWPNWLEQLPEFASQWRVVALDLPGFGHSPMPSQTITIPGYARLLDGLLEHLGVNAAAVVGNSMGGFIAAELAIAFPQRVERLTLVSAAGVSTYAHPGAMRAVPVLERTGLVLTAIGAWAASKADAVARRRRLRESALALVVRDPSALPAAVAAEQIRGAGKPGFLQGLRANLEYDFRERLPEVACPTLIVWGADDRLITVRDADVYERLIPNSRKVVLQRTGHMAMLERPAEFNALLRDFLEE